MTRRILLLTICLLTVALHAHADPVDVEAARQKAAAFLQGQKAKGARRRAPAARQLTMAAAGPQDSYYIFNAKEGQGYVVVSGEDATEDILGYSNTGTIDTTSMPCGMKMLLDGYADQIAFLRRNGITRKQNRASSTRAKANSSTELTSFRVDESRLTYYYQVAWIDADYWTGYPFNYHCPYEGGVTGCVATALAGLMYAYQWPKKTFSEIPGYTSYYLERPLSQFKMSVDGIPAKTEIDWKNIKERYNINSQGDSVYAIANLLKIAGVSVKTDYSITNSVAHTERVEDALKDYFGYDESVVYHSRWKYRKDVWRDMLREELINNGPVVYSGFNNLRKDEGHAFLLEGFNGDYFHVNFGWGDGSKDSRFLLDVLDYDDGEFEYSSFQGAVFGVQPIPHVELEVTQLSIERGSIEEGTFMDTSLQGRLTVHHKGNAGNVKLIFLKLTDVETGEYIPRVIITSLSPDDSRTFLFSFSGLSTGDHYVLSALDFFDDVFYNSPELLCTEDPAFAEDDETEGNETLTRFEYWFDNDFSSRRVKTLSSKKAALKGSLNTDHLQNGLHSLNFRVQRNDNSWSGIRTSRFLKLNQRSAEARLDYWLDDDYDTRVSLPLNLSKSEDEQLLTFNLSDCAVGLHHLCYQVTLPGSLPSAVQRAAVMKLPMGATPQMEYWFDEDIAHSATLTGSMKEALGGYVYVNTLDLSNLPVGLHCVNFRATGSDGVKRSPVMSMSVMKVPMGKGGGLEYWYDDDEANAVTLSGVSEDDGLVYESQLDMSSLPVGLHRLSFRAICGDGQKKSPSVTCYVMRNVTGSISRLEYWFDDDRDHVFTMSGHAAEAGEPGYIFRGELDISGLRPGHHRLHYRGIGSGGQLSTAAGSASILVKLDANGDATMASYSISVDGGIPIAQGSLAARAEVDFNYVLDANDLDNGLHMLRTTFWNNYGVSVTEDTPFLVTTVDEDAVRIPLADEESDGYIYNLSGMRVNSNAKGILIKNGKKYIVK